MGVQDRAVAFREHDDRVDLIDLHVDDQEVVKIHSFYVSYLLPMMCEVQWWEFPDVSGVRSRSVSSSPRAGSSSTAAGAVPTRGSARWSWPSWPNRSATTICGSTTTSRPCPGVEPTHVLRGLHHAGRALAADVAGAARSAGDAAPPTGTPACWPRRPPASTCTRDGRLILGLGAGWFHEEYHSYGYEYLPDPERLAVLDETIEVVRRLWSEETVTYDGDHLHFDGAYCDPKPVQSPPPILVGGGGEQVNLRIAARRADLTNWQVGLDALRTQVEPARTILRGDRAALRGDHPHPRPGLPDLRHRGGDARVVRDPTAAAISGGHPDRRYLADNLVGTVEQVIEKTQAFVDAGCRGSSCGSATSPSDETLRRFMAEVVPALKVP